MSSAATTAASRTPQSVTIAAAPADLRAQPPGCRRSSRYQPRYAASSHHQDISPGPTRLDGPLLCCALKRAAVLGEQIRPVRQVPAACGAAPANYRVARGAPGCTPSTETSFNPRRRQLRGQRGHRDPRPTRSALVGSLRLVGAARAGGRGARSPRVGRATWSSTLGGAPMSGKRVGGVDDGGSAVGPVLRPAGGSGARLSTSTSGRTRAGRQQTRGRGAGGGAR